MFFHEPEKISLGSAIDIVVLTPKSPSPFKVPLKAKPIVKAIPPLLPENLTMDLLNQRISEGTSSSTVVIFVSLAL